MENIKYKSKGFAEYYSTHRHTWEEYYDSERKIIERAVASFDRPISVLDVGCGCGGLGVAMSTKFKLSMYKGIDINESNIEEASTNTRKHITCPNEFSLEDVSLMNEDNKYDMVISLSCVDFNVDVDGMIRKCWERVCTGGYFIMSARLTNVEGISDISKSYQWIDKEKTEVASYVVFNYSDLLNRLSALKEVNIIDGYGYWGKPAASAVTQYDNLCFSVVAIKKGSGGGARALLDMPSDLFYLKS